MDNTKKWRILTRENEQCQAERDGRAEKSSALVGKKGGRIRSYRGLGDFYRDHGDIIAARLGTAKACQPGQDGVDDLLRVAL